MPLSQIHVGIIMDGNGRWATRRGQPRSAGHLAGAETLRSVVEAAPGLGIRTLTLYAFSSDNWKRPPAEVKVLMGLIGRYLRSEAKRCVTEGVRLSVIGRRDRLSPTLVRAIEHAEALTEGGATLHLRVAVDYSSRDAILRAVAAAPAGVDRDGFSALLGPDVDLVIRTGGEQRLSDFLLWECAYAELLFSPTMWPDFDGAALAAAITEFRGRDRRFGRAPEVVAKPVRRGAGK